MKKYQLVIDDPQFWREVKKKCASCDVTVREVITELLKSWIKGDLDKYIDFEKDDSV